MVERELEPEEYRVSVAEAMYVAGFDTGYVFDHETVQSVVEKSGMTYAGTKLVARGDLVEENGELLMVDEETEMRILLVAGEEEEQEERFADLREALEVAEEFDGPAHVWGRLLEGEEATEQAEVVGAHHVMTVESFELDPEEYELPPVYPEEDDSDSGWF